MGIKQELDGRYLQAMRSRDARTTEVIRAVRARVLEERKKASFKGEEDDTMYLSVVSAIVKQLTKAIPDFERAGESGRETVERYQFEIDYLSKLLPEKLGEDATRALVLETIEALGASGPKQFGRVMGAVMKDHRDDVDAALVRRMIEAALA